MNVDGYVRVSTVDGRRGPSFIIAQRRRAIDERLDCIFISAGRGR